MLNFMPTLFAIFIRTVPSAFLIGSGLLNAAFAADELDMSCVRNESVSIKSIQLHESLEHVIKRLGKPVKKTEGFSEDDGGQYLHTIFEYSDLIIEFNREQVSLLKPVNRSVEATYGIRVGESLKAISQRTGIDLMQQAETSNPVYLFICPGDTGYIKLHYDTNQRISEYSIVYESP